MESGPQTDRVTKFAAGFFAVTDGRSELHHLTGLKADILK